MSTFRQKLSTGSSSSSSSGSSSSCSDSESASTHSSTQSDESPHETDNTNNKNATQNNNHLPSFSETSDEEEPPKRRKLPEARFPQLSTAARPASSTSIHSKHNTSPAPSLASTSSRRNGYSSGRPPSTSRPPSVSQPSTTNNIMNIFTASRASSSLSIKSPELSGGSTESKTSSSSSENDSPSTTNYTQSFGNVTSTQQNFSQINGSKKPTRKKGRIEMESTVEARVAKERETPATAMERMVIDEEMLNEIKIEVKSEDEEFEQNKSEVKNVAIVAEKIKSNKKSTTTTKSNKQQAKKLNKESSVSSSSSSSGEGSSSSESESSEDVAKQSSKKRIAKPTTMKQRKSSKDSKSQATTTTVNDVKKNNNIDALFDELKKTSPSQSLSNKCEDADTEEKLTTHKKSGKNVKSSSSSVNNNGKAQINGTRKRARPPESSEKSEEYSSDSDDSDLAPLMTRADAEVATKVFGKRLSTQQSSENGPCLRATRSMKATTTSKLANGKKQSDESGSDTSASSSRTNDSSGSGSASASKSSSATGSASDSGSASVSPSGSDSESSSHSSCSSCHSADSSSLPEVRKAVRGKRAQNSNSSSIAPDETPRKLTRSRRRLQQRVDTDSDSDQAVNGGGERLLNGERQVNGNTAGIAKRPLGLNGKSRGFLNSLLRESPPICISPPCVQEKMCPIEGCDSKGHLGGTRDRHFLPEACPLYHNMTSEECIQMLIERRKHAETFPLPVKPDADEQEDSYGAKRVRTTAQKELWDRIHQSWRDFEENPPQPKPQVECEEGNEQREQDLTGMAPEYDLELFRRAQAIAAEAIEDEVADCPVGKGIKYIIMGKYKMKVWYQSPYPDDAARLPKMYICEYCLRYQKSEVAIKRHALKCVWRHPPGDEIYRKGKLQVWQVDGKTQKQYCQHLCLLAKFFLDHKTLYYDVEPFLFYIMTLADIDGCHIVGYFSKEKNSFYNVSCILTLPPYQRKGYGRLLIDFSYLLTRVEGKIGSPEKPLSDLGLISYRSYWKDVLLEYLINRSGNTVSIKDISKEMAIYSYDIVSTLQALGMMKYWKGKHIILKKQDVIDDYLERVSRRGKFPKIDETCLRWSPFVPPDSDNPNL